MSVVEISYFAMAVSEAVVRNAAKLILVIIVIFLDVITKNAVIVVYITAMIRMKSIAKSNLVPTVRKRYAFLAMISTSVEKKKF